MYGISKHHFFTHMTFLLKLQAKMSILTIISPIQKQKVGAVRHRTNLDSYR